MEPTRCRRLLHGDDRQPAVRLDAVRQPHRPEIPMGRPPPFNWRSVSSLLSKHGWCRSKAGSSTALVRVSMVALGGVFVAAAWTLNSMANSLWLLYVAAVLSGIGAGAVYGTCVGNALKWFPDLRGLAAGLTAAGFGAGTAATVIPIREMIVGYGYEAAFLWFGLGQGLVLVLLSRLLRAPRPGETPKPAGRLTHSLRDYTTAEMVRSPVFWLMYLMFIMVAGVRPDGDGTGRANCPRLRYRRRGRQHLLHNGDDAERGAGHRQHPATAWRARSSAGFQTLSAVRSRWAWCSRSAPWRIGGSVRSDTRRPCSSYSPG